MTIRRNPKLLAAIVSAAMAMTHAAPSLAATITADQFTQDVIQDLSIGDIEGARHRLLQAQAYGMKYLEVDGVKYEIDTLIDQLRGGHKHAASVIAKLRGAHSIFVPCDGPWVSKAHLGAPPSPPADLFPTGSHGVC